MYFIYRVSHGPVGLKGISQYLGENCCSPNPPLPLILPLQIAKNKSFSLCEAFMSYKTFPHPISPPLLQAEQFHCGLPKTILESLFLQDLELNVMPLNAHRKCQNSLKEFLSLNTNASAKNWLSNFSIVCQTHL